MCSHHSIYKSSELPFQAFHLIKQRVACLSVHNDNWLNPCVQISISWLLSSISIPYASSNKTIQSIGNQLSLGVQAFDISIGSNVLIGFQILPDYSEALETWLEACLYLILQNCLCSLKFFLDYFLRLSVLVSDFQDIWNFEEFTWMPQSLDLWKWGECDVIQF